MATRKPVEKTEVDAKAAYDKAADKAAERAQVPDGYVQVTAANCLNFFKPNPNPDAPPDTCEGVLLGEYEKTTGDFPGTYFQLELLKDCTCALIPSGNGKDFVPGTLAAGEVINVDCKDSIKNLKQYADMKNAGKYQAFIMSSGRIKIKGGRQDFWKLQAFVKARD